MRFQAWVLLRLCEGHQSISLGQLLELTGWDPDETMSLAQELADNGLATIETGEQTVLTITPKGEAAIQKMLETRFPL
jgi:predicted transcriptional regulator